MWYRGDVYLDDSSFLADIWRFDFFQLLDKNNGVGGSMDLQVEGNEHLQNILDMSFVSP